MTINVPPELLSEMIAARLSYKAMARRLGCAPRTVEALFKRRGIKYPLTRRAGRSHPTTRLYFRVSPELHATLGARAIAEGLPLSIYIENILIAHLESTP